MTTTRTAALALSCLLLVTVQTAYGQLSTIPSLIPPAGNSPKTVLTTSGGSQVYSCVNGAWVVSQASAALLDSTTEKNVGNYTLTVDPVNGAVRTWTLVNSIGDRDESGGDVASWVKGTILTSVGSSNTSSLPDMLLEAESHGNDGAVAAVSYIQAYNAEGGGPPPQDSCDSNSTPSTTVTVTFKSWFCFFQQDPVPTSVPKQLMPPARVLEGFFGTGSITYKFDGRAWVECGRAGSLYSLPGSPVIGEFWEKAGVQFWELYKPNGFTVYAKSSEGVQVDKNACSWTLSTVTSQPSSTWSLGQCSHVQTTSTRGGLPPIMADSGTPLVGTKQNVTFSAIYWFFTSGPMGLSY